MYFVEALNFPPKSANNSDDQNLTFLQEHPLMTLLRQISKLVILGGTHAGEKVIFVIHLLKSCFYQTG